MRENRMMDVVVQEERTVYTCDTCRTEEAGNPFALPLGWWSAFYQRGDEPSDANLRHWCGDDCIAKAFTRTAVPA